MTKSLETRRFTCFASGVLVYRRRAAVYRRDSAREITTSHNETRMYANGSIGDSSERSRQMHVSRDFSSRRLPSPSLPSFICDREERVDAIVNVTQARMYQSAIEARHARKRATARLNNHWRDSNEFTQPFLLLSFLSVAFYLDQSIYKTRRYSTSFEILIKRATNRIRACRSALHAPLKGTPG